MRLWRWLSGRQIDYLFKTRPFKEARLLPVFATKRWGLVIVHWPVSSSQENPDA